MLRSRYDASDSDDDKNEPDELTEDMVENVRELFAEHDNARCSIVATKPGYVTIPQCTIDTPGIAER